MIAAPSPRLRLGPPLSEAQLQRLTRLGARLPMAWMATPRRRRWLVLALAAPGFVLVFSTPLHRNLALLCLGLGLFGLALLFRRLTESLLLSAEAAGLWPRPHPSPAPTQREAHPHD